MDINIRKLTPELTDDYLHFFDTTPHFTDKDEDRCYCVCWCNVNYENQDFSTAEKEGIQPLHTSMEIISKDTLHIVTTRLLGGVMQTRNQIV